jgi:hypothetical protein
MAKPDRDLILALMDLGYNGGYAALAARAESAEEALAILHPEFVRFLRGRDLLAAHFGEPVDADGLALSGGHWEGRADYWREDNEERAEVEALREKARTMRRMLGFALMWLENAKHTGARHLRRWMDAEDIDPAEPPSLPPQEER